MALTNSASRWGGIAKAFHWTLAILILGSSLFILHVNDTMPWFKSGPAIYIKYIHWHKAFGLIALALVVLRLLWTLSQPHPETAPLTPAEKKASKWTHRTLYLLMFLVPISGWVASSAFGSATKFWGLFTVPGIIAKNKALVGPGYWVHYGLAWAILALVAFHAGAALYHHFKRRDRVLTAMLPGGD